MKKSFQKGIGLIFILMLLLILIPVNAMAEDAIGNPEETTPTDELHENSIETDSLSNFTYTPITGGISITGYTGNDTNVIIPSSIDGKRVLGIGDYAFRLCTKITSISIPETVTNIGIAPFVNCSSLIRIDVAADNSSYMSIDGVLVDKAGTTLIACPGGLANVNIPNGITNINYRAFYYNYNLKNINIPDTVISIGNQSFYYCTGLTNISIPNSVQNIGQQAFSFCSSLTSIDVATSNPNYSSFDGMLFDKGGNTLVECAGGLTSVNIPNNVTKIDDYAFEDCAKITTINVPENVSQIGIWAFRVCSHLTSIQINSADTVIDDDQNTFPPTTTIIGYNPSTAKNYADKFNRTFRLIGTQDNPETVFPSNITLNKTTLTLSVGNTDKLTPSLNPSNVTDNSVTWSSSDSSVVTVDASGNIKGIKAGIATITATTVNNLNASCAVTVNKVNDTNGDFSFTSINGGISITGYKGSNSNVVIPSMIDGKKVLSIGKRAFADCTNLTSISLPNGMTSIEEFAFSGCTNLISANLPDSITRIGWCAFFNCFSLKNINIPTGVTTIEGLLVNCNSLVSITIPENIKTIGDSSFSGCSSLTSINIPKSVTSINGWAFDKCPNLIKINVDVNNPAYSSINGVLFDKSLSTLIIHPPKSTVVNLPKSITKIGDNAFGEDSNLSNIIIPNNVTDIGYGAFSGCSALTNIIIPNSVTNIGHSAFYGCSALTSVIIPDSVTSISDSAFFGCSALTNIIIPNSVTNIGNGAFYGCSSLTNIIIPDSVTHVDYLAFYECSALASIQFNSPTTEIVNMVNVIPATATIIGHNPSTAQNYAQKYNLTFKEIENSEKILPTSIILNKTNLSLTIDNNEQLIPSLKPSDATDKTITWISSNSSIAAVDSNGNVKGIKAGTAIITATTSNNLTAKCTVTVNASDEINTDFTYSLIKGGVKITGYTTDASDIEIPSTIENEPVITIDNWAFSDRTALNSVTIPDTVKNIGEGSFSGCTNLTTVILPDNLKSIGSGAFRLCENLTTINLPDNISYQGEGAFYSCKSLTSIHIPSNITTLYANTFKDCTNLETITIPEGINLVGYSAFLGCNNLETIQFNSATTKIVDFENVIPSTTTIIGYDPSTAKDYAKKYNRNFKALSNQNNDTPSISYQTHVQDVGWQDWKSDGIMSGTTGRSLRLEGIRIKLNNDENLGIEYQTHIENIGWEANTGRGWKSDGDMSGTYGQSLRLEAIQIKLTGADADKYDIYYQVHAQNIGWMGWAKNGENAGTAGFSYRLEGIRIKIVPKGNPAPSDNVSYANPFKENIESPYSSILQEYRVAEANGFSQAVIKALPNVNTELYGSSYKTKLYYILEDISGDNSPELVIAMYNPKYNNSVHPSDFQIYDAYRLNNGVPERIFDIYTMGYRSIYTICENQIIRCYGSGGVNAHGDTFYKLDGNNTSTIQTVTYDKPYYILNDAKNNNRTITKTEADKIINSYAPRTDINWIKL